GLLSKGAELLYHNARPHFAAVTVQTLQQVRFEVLEHLLYCPDVTHSDYHLFGPLKTVFKN
ncbi:Histone-lysine N-methyltransferase SETMAR, partial [Habropoda laboriosa]